MERQAMHDMAHTMLGSTSESLEIQALWEEYEAAKTPEALAVKDIDKFEVCCFSRTPEDDAQKLTRPNWQMIVQAHEYEKSKSRTTIPILSLTSMVLIANQLKEPLDSFFECTQGKFKHPIIQGWVQDLYKERAEWLESRKKS